MTFRGMERHKITRCSARVFVFFMECDAFRAIALFVYALSSFAFTLAIWRFLYRRGSIPNRAEADEIYGIGF